MKVGSLVCFISRYRSESNDIGSVGIILQCNVVNCLVYFLDGVARLIHNSCLEILSESNKEKTTKCRFAE